MVHFDAIVIGGGHAGCEAASAAARMGLRVGLCTMSRDTVARMPCNPAIGGTAKGHLVREIDALGGLMGRAIDATGIQFKLLNRSRGPAVWSPRAQADKQLYGAWIGASLSRLEGITWLFGKAARVIVSGSRVAGIVLEDGSEVRCTCLIVTTGTFLNGVVHIGRQRRAAGRAGEPPSNELAESIRSLGFRMGRLKTGTPPRLHRRSIDTTKMKRELGDDRPTPFSFSTDRICRSQIACYLIHTTAAVHDLVRQHLDESPLFNGQIEGIGPRYCPSLEDKVVRFPNRERHQVFLEPEGLDVDEVYVNGLSMSLPAEVQTAIVRALPGLEQAEVLRPGYAVEYDFVQPTVLGPSLESTDIEGLFFAGQINGTSGYEEAAGQGLLAGINAAQRVRGRPPLVLGRTEAYLGIMVDDLTTQGCLEPYRMFTSRAEHRLLLRIDNADLRLTPRGRQLGLIGTDDWERFTARRTRLLRNRAVLDEAMLSAPDGPSLPARRRLCQPGFDLKACAERGELAIEWRDGIGDLDLASLEAEVRYEGYIRRERSAVKKRLREESRRIPAGFGFGGIPGLSREVAQRLAEIRPHTLGQARRIPGVTPAALAVLGSLLSKPVSAARGFSGLDGRGGQASAGSDQR